MNSSSLGVNAIDVRKKYWNEKFARKSFFNFSDGFFGVQNFVKVSAELCEDFNNFRRISTAFQVFF